MSLITDGFPNLRDPKIMVKEISEKFTFRGPFNKQHAKGTKHCWNLNHTTFSIFLAHCEANWYAENLS